MNGAFIFDGISSQMYHVLAVSIGGNSDTFVSAGIATDLSTNSLKKNYTFPILCQNYNEPIRFTLELVNEDASPIDKNKERELKKWLCKRGEYKWMQLCDKEYGDIFYRVNISNPQLYVLNQVYGMKFECAADAPFGYSPKITKKFEITNTKKSFDVKINTDEEDYIYPYAEITLLEPGELIIKNSTEPEHRTLKIISLVVNETITLDCLLPDIVSSQNGRTVFRSFNRHWLRFTNGSNVLTFNKNCLVKIQYREIRKVGIYE